MLLGEKIPVAALAPIPLEAVCFRPYRESGVAKRIGKRGGWDRVSTAECPKDSAQVMIE